MNKYYKKSDGLVYAINYSDPYPEESVQDNFDTLGDNKAPNSSHQDTIDSKYCNRYENLKTAAKQVLQIFTAAAILVVSIVGFSAAVSFFDKNIKIQDLKSYDGFIWPVVMQDPKPFDENTPPDPNMMVRASIWDACEAHKQNDNIVSDGPKLILSEDEVQMSSRKLFGKEIDLKNPFLEDAYFYRFDKEAKKFSVSAISADQCFQPNTISAKPNEESTVLNVGYVIPQNQFNSQMNQVIENKVEKFAEYVLKDNPLLEGKYIAAVK